MAPDDPGSVRELRFRHGANHIIVTASPDGTGTVSVHGNLIESPVDQEDRKAALMATLKMLSIARHAVFEEYTQAGGTLEELRASIDIE